jgi:MFS family permease
MGGGSLMWRKVLRDRRLRVLLVGQVLNMFGNTALVIALGIWVLELTGSSGAAGVIFFLIAVPTLCAPFIGLLVDRFPRREVLIWADLGACVLVSLLVFWPSVWLIYVVALGYGVSAQVYRAARGGLVHSMVTEDELGDVNSVFGALNQALRIVGPLAGAGVFAAFGGSAVAALDAVTYLASIVSLLVLRGVPDLTRTPDREPVVPALLAGVRHILATPALRQMVIAGAVAFTGAGMLNVAVFDLVTTGLGRPPEFLGVLGSVQGAGAVLGALVVGGLMRRRGEFVTAAAGFLLNGAGLGLAATATLPGVCAGAVLIGLGLPMILVAAVTLVQRRTPNEVQGRAIAASEAMVDLPYAVAIGVATVVISAVGYFAIYVVQAAVFLAVGLVVLRIRDQARQTA